MFYLSIKNNKRNQNKQNKNIAIDKRFGDFFAVKMMRKKNTKLNKYCN